MMGWQRSLIELCAVSIVSFFVGRLWANRIPAGHLQGEGFPFRVHPIEGRVYRALMVHRWKDRVPDMSRLFRGLPGIIPEKRLTERLDAAQVDVMLRETCVAEGVHSALALYGIVQTLLWTSPASRLFGVLYAIGNLPFIVIQRYNRPKLVRLQKRLRAREGLDICCNSTENVIYDEHPNTGEGTSFKL